MRYAEKFDLRFDHNKIMVKHYINANEISPGAGPEVNLKNFNLKGSILVQRKLAQQAFQHYSIYLELPQIVYR